MVPDLDPGIPQEARRLRRVFDGAAPPVEGEDGIVEVLDPEFHLGHPEVEHPVDMLLPAPVGTGLERGGNAPDRREFVLQEDPGRICPGGRGGSPVLVHGADAFPDEPLLVFRRPGRHRPAHDDQLHLVDVVAQQLELLEACPDL